MQPEMNKSDARPLSNTNIVIDLSKRQERMISSIYIQEDQDTTDHISCPTIPESFEDDFSLAASTHHSNNPPRPQQLSSNLPYACMDDAASDTGLSMSSMNTKAVQKIHELRKRLRIQENTKFELLNQCLDLERRLEKNDTRNAYVRIYKSENHKLRESSARMERDFMNAMNEVVGKMHAMEEEYEEKMKEKDSGIWKLETELKLLRVAKNLEDVTTSTGLSLWGGRTMLTGATSGEYSC